MRVFGTWLWLIIKRYVRNGCPFQAAYLAYLTLITLVPLLALSLIVLTHISVFTPMIDQLQKWLLTALLVNVADHVIQTIHHWVEQAAALSWKHTIFFVGMAVLIMFNLNRIFRDVWHTEKRLSWSIHLAVYSFILLCSPLLLGLLFIISGVLFQSESISYWLMIHHLHQPLVILIPDLVLFVWLTLMNWALPLCRVPFRAAVLSGAVTTILLIITKKLYALIVINSSFEMLYGTLSVIPLFLAWLYVAWCIIIFGAMIGHEYATR